MYNRLVLVTGGASCGKSAVAEKICADWGRKLAYVATMQPYGQDALGRIERHRLLRAGKGFDTIEHYTSLAELALPSRYDTVLIECLGNVVANQMFEENTADSAIKASVLLGVEKLLKQGVFLVVVTNDVFAGSEQYHGKMAHYIKCLALINQLVAQRADTVIELVCGLPITMKGRYPFEKPD